MRHADLTRAFERIPGTPLRGFFFRAVPLTYVTTPLSAIGSISGGRYNASNAFLIYYVTEKPDVTLRETNIIIRGVRPAPIRPTVLFTINAVLEHVVDLTRDDVRDELRITANELLIDWKKELLAGNTPVTHQIGAAARAANVEALLVPSARIAGAKNLAILVDRMRATSSLTISPKDGFGDTAIVLTGTR
jgi:RES domain-containing protein